MFPPNQQKLPRPRSSLSTDESRFKGGIRRRKHPTNAVLTLVGCCLFLFVLCFFLLGALVVVGRSLVKDEISNSSTISSSLLFYGDNNKHSININNPNLRSICNELNYKQKVIFRPAEVSRDLSNIIDNNKELSTLPTGSFSNKRNSSSATVLSKDIMKTSKILNKLSFRLPKELRPKHYQLLLKPDLKAKTFSGNITIRIEVLSPIAFVPVHCKRLNVSTRKFNKIEKDNELHSIKPLLTYEHPDLEYWVTEFENNLEIGEYSMQLDFNGSLIDRIVGFYQSSYIDTKTNESRSIATSKFEPTYARTAFPCFDEPDKKAKFEITLVTPSYDNYTALSNMNVESTEKFDDYHTAVKFAESVPMSTYLACFIVSDFQSKSREIQTGGIGKNFDLRVFSTPAQLDKVQHALDTGAGVTEYYIQYFNIEYPLPKLDMAAIPDFVSGAMEHWGLVTFRETTLLFDSETSSSANKQRVAEVVAHELAHMWFGNLVTMKWWNDLWLNEGFASYIEYKGVDKVFPEWKMLDQFIINDLHGVLKLDATLASHPIVQKVESPDQITELFDSITYSKGASIIRMLEHFVSPEKFQEAVSNYLKAYQFGNANTEDLLTEIENLGFPFDAKIIMKTWTEQMGVPVVDVHKISNTEYKLTQKRFFANPEDYNGTYDDSPFNYHWSIPITSFTSDNPNAELRWFNYNDAEVTITLPTAPKWIKLNKDQVGYYRVNYPDDMWHSLTQALIDTPEAFSISDRAHLINDVFALADATQVPYNIALDITRYLEKEVDFVPWSVAASKLISLKNLLRYTDTYKSYSKHVRKLLNKAYTEVTWTVGTDHLQNSLRVKILNAACSLGHEDCMQEVSHKFNQWQSNLDVKPSPDIRTTVYYYGMMVAGTETNWEKIWDLFKNEQDASEKSKLMQGLAGIREPYILSRFIDLSWDENNVRGQDYFTCLKNIAANPVGEGLVWDYVRENWEKLVGRFSLNDRYLGSLIPSITAHFTTELKLEEMNIFFKKYPEAGAGTAARKQALETVKNNIKWLAENKNKISMWLSNNQS